MSMSPRSGWLDDVDRCVECSADPTEDARRTESGKGDIMVTRQAAAAQQWAETRLCNLKCDTTLLKKANTTLIVDNSLNCSLLTT